MYMGKQRPLLLIPFDLCFCFCLCLRRFEMEKERRVDRERGLYIILRIQNQPAFVSFPTCAPGLKFPFQHLAALQFVENGKTFFLPLLLFPPFLRESKVSAQSSLSLSFPPGLCFLHLWVGNGFRFCQGNWQQPQKIQFRFPNLFPAFSWSFFDFAGKSLFSPLFLGKARTLNLPYLGVLKKLLWNF